MRVLGAQHSPGPQRNRVSRDGVLRFFALAAALALAGAAAPAASAASLDLKTNPAGSSFPVGKAIDVDASWSFPPGGTHTYYLRTTRGKLAHCSRTPPRGPDFPKSGCWSLQDVTSFPTYAGTFADGGFGDVLHSVPAGNTTLTGYIATSDKRVLAKDSVTLTFTKAAYTFSLKLKGAPYQGVGNLGVTYVRSSAGGSGKSFLTTWNGENAEGGMSGSHGTFLIIHKHLHGDDRIAMRILDRARVGAHTVRAEYSLVGGFTYLVFPVRVSASDAPDCPKGRMGLIELADAGSRADDRFSVSLCGDKLLYGNGQSGASVQANIKRRT